MSKETSQTIKRQWHILLYLQAGNYVSTSNIRDYLAQQGIESELRAIQRDLNQLEKEFPLECRRDSMPHSWRWKRHAESLEMPMTTAQAATFLLIESQLHDVIPTTMYVNLQPFFVMAKRKIGSSQEMLPNIPQHKVGIGSAVGSAKAAAGIPTIWSILGNIVAPKPKERWSAPEQQQVLMDLTLLLKAQSLEFLILEINQLVEIEQDRQT